MEIPYVDFTYQTSELKNELMEAVSSVLDSGHFILGPNVEKFEEEIASYCGTKYAVGVSNGTSALYLGLKALGVGEGDEVITAPNSFIASASAIALVGATPTFADVDWDMNIDPAKIEASITPKTKAIMPVHLAGRVAKMDEILKIAKKHGLYVIEDAAQSVGAKLQNKRAGSFGDIGCFSLHPLKNLHAFGDAGFVTTDNPEVFERLKILRNLGLKNRDCCVFWCGNDRLDEMQAALLRINLRHLEKFTQERRQIAYRLNKELADVVVTPVEGVGESNVFQTYVIQAEKRDELLQFLKENGVGGNIHYPTPIHLQPAAQALGYKKGDFPVTEELSKKIMSLPCFPGMTEQMQAKQIELIRSFYAR